MKTIIAGSRDFDDYDCMCAVMEICGIKPSLVISGTAKGADQLGEQWAKEHGISIKRMSADWDRFGRRAGYLRNEAMAQEADALVAFWNGVSKGTAHMIDIARTKGLRSYVYNYITKDVF